jgi:asparagine synthase (glutamine-hydrolysing)
VTVALGGDGGDELFAGYPTFQAHRLAQFYRVPRALHEQFIRPLAARLPVSHENFSLGFKLNRFLRGAGFRPEIRDQVWVGSFTPEEQGALLNGTSTEVDHYEDIVEAEAHCNAPSSEERLIYLYCKFYLQDDILAKVDRASMARSLEVRAPFLDYTFVEFLNTLPFDLKLRGLTTKYILKKAMRDKLPSEILTRSKKGFGIPVGRWFQDRLQGLARETFSEQRLKQQGLFNHRTVARLFNEHLTGVRDHRKQLWTLFIFQLWFEKYFSKSAPAPGS